MRCIVGLGNPEPRYVHTRHNIGFQVVDRTVSLLNISFRSGKGEYYHARGRLGREDVLLVKPTTYMNRSGIAVSHVANYFRIAFEELLIVLDDLDLPFGTLRFRKKGSDGGNKGLRSIITETGSEDIARLRIGIRNRETIANPSSYVLSKFNRKENIVLPALLNLSSDAVQCWINDGIETAMNRFNRHFNLENIS